MAKKKAQGRRRGKSKANDFKPTGQLEIVDGFFIDTRLKIGGMQLIESMLNKPFMAVNWAKANVKELVALLIALAMQADKKMTIDKARGVIEDLDGQQLIDVTNKINEIMGVSSKNSKRPAGKKMS